MGQTDKRKRRKGINVVYNISNELPKTAFEMETNNSNNKDLDEKEPDPVTIKELFRFASYSDIIWISFGVLFSILGGIIQPTVLIFDGYITSIFLRKEEKVGNDQFAADVKSYIILLGIGSIISFICTYLQTYMLHRGCINMICKIRRAFLQSVSRQDAVWFDRNSSGNIMTQLTDHINRIEDGLGNKIGLIIRGFSMFISSVIICMYINWKLTIISLTMGPISAITMGFLEKFLAEPAASLLSVNAEAGELVEESVMNVKTVASCNAQDYIVEKYKKILETGRHFVVKYHTLLGFSDGITFFEIYVIIGLALGFGVWGFFNGHVQLPGDIILVINTISLSGYYLGLLGPHVLAMIKARVAAAIIYKTIDRIPEQRIDDTSGIQLENVKGDITFDNVHFTYPTRSTSILNGLSWEAKAGETIAFVGSSGCGKSTSIGLLTRLYSQSTGKITIDGKPVDRINIASLRQNVGVVKQEPVLFNGTIMENIVLGRKNITEDQAMEAARITGVHNFISNLELGYNTQLGNDGINLSGGQKQRLAIARTIVTQPKILLLDEATSALDTESEQKLHKALMKTSKERTTIIIAHRLSTLKNVDRIYVIENGVIIENGAHEELIAQRGVYFDLAKSQEVHQRQEDTYKSDVPSTSTNYTQNDTRNISQKFSVVGRQSYIDDDDEDDENDIEVLQGFKLIFTNMQGNYGKFAASIFFCLLRSTELPFFGLSCYLAFKALQETADTYQAWAIWMMACSFTCSILIWLALVFQNMLSGLTAENVVNNMKVQALRSLLHRESEEFDQKNNNPSACISLLANHPPNILAGIDYRFMYYLTNVFAVLIGSIVCWNVLWEIAAIGTILCIILYILSFTSIIFANNARDRKEKEDNSFEHAVEIVEQCRSIQLLSTEKFFLSKYDEHQQLSKKFDYSIGHVNSFNFAIMQGFVFLSDMACFGIGTYLAYTGKYHVDTVYLACTAAQVSGWSVMYSAPNIPEIIRAASSAKQLFRVITSPKNILSRKNKGIKLDIEGKVEAKRLQFAYPTNPDNMVARNLNFIVKTGQHIALVGKSGCGKSTVINLMEKFYHARKGDILIDNNRIEEINTHHLRNQIALVGQEPILFKGSIYENVTMGLSNIPLEKVRQACKAANAAHFIESFPSGYDTDVGEKGRALSGGQKQRIAIARALIRNPKILLLDEATSALDTQSEEMVQQAINNASKDRTCISIAHRLSTIQNCDKIYLIDQGSVIECGTHSELLALNGAYANLVEAQRLQDNQ